MHRSNMSFQNQLALFLYCSLSFTLSGQVDNKANKYLGPPKEYLDADCPVADDCIKHFVYFARDREGIKDPLFIEQERFSGAQIMYPWSILEPEKDSYDFSAIAEDYNYLKSHGKMLFIQLQDITFDHGFKGIPEYLATDVYDGGAIVQTNDSGKPDGWAAKRWNPKVQERFALLIMELGKAFDGKVEGINLQETALAIDQTIDPSFTPEAYVRGIKANMLALKMGFPQSTTLQYANFMPGEWLPWEDRDYLRSIYGYGEQIGVGLGAPDLMFERKAQLNHALGLMHDGDFTIPLSIAVQDGNYIGKTGADQDYHEEEDHGRPGRDNLVPQLHAFAKEFLRVSYIFWGHQAPYFNEDLVTCLADR